MSDSSVPKSDTEMAGEGQQVNASLPSTEVPTVDGVIDNKIDGVGSVALGNKSLRGATSRTKRPLQYFEAGNSSEATEPLHRRRKPRRDMMHPKKNRSAYNFFVSRQRALLKPLYVGTDKDISRTIVDMWNDLSDAAKAPYQEMSMKDKERYQSEMAAYRAQQAGQVADNAELQHEDAQYVFKTDEFKFSSGEIADMNTDGEEMSDEQEFTAAEDSADSADSTVEADRFELRMREKVEPESTSASSAAAAAADPAGNAPGPTEDIATPPATANN